MSNNLQQKNYLAMKTNMKVIVYILKTGYSLPLLNEENVIFGLYFCVTDREMTTYQNTIKRLQETVNKHKSEINQIQSCAINIVAAYFTTNRTFSLLLCFIPCFKSCSIIIYLLLHIISIFNYLG